MKMIIACYELVAFKALLSLEGNLLKQFDILIPIFKSNKII